MLHNRRLWLALLAASMIHAGASAGQAGKTVKINHGGAKSWAGANGTFGATAYYHGQGATLDLVADIDALALGKPLNAIVHFGASLLASPKKKPTISIGALVANKRVLSTGSRSTFDLDFENAGQLARIGRSHMVGPVAIELYASVVSGCAAMARFGGSEQTVSAQVQHVHSWVRIDYSGSAGVSFGPDRWFSASADVMEAQMNTFIDYPLLGSHTVYWDLWKGGHAGDGVNLVLLPTSSADILVHAERGKQSYSDSVAKWKSPADFKTVKLLPKRAW